MRTGVRAGDGSVSKLAMNQTKISEWQEEVGELDPRPEYCFSSKRFIIQVLLCLVLHHSYLNQSTSSALQPWQRIEEHFGDLPGGPVRLELLPGGHRV